MPHVEVLSLRGAQSGSEGCQNGVQDTDEGGYRAQHGMRQLFRGPSIHIDKDHYEGRQCQTPGEHHAGAVPLKRRKPYFTTRNISETSTVLVAI